MKDTVRFRDLRPGDLVLMLSLDFRDLKPLNPKWYILTTSFQDKEFLKWNTFALESQRERLLFSDLPGVYLSTRAHYADTLLFFRDGKQLDGENYWKIARWKKSDLHKFGIVL